MSSPNPQYRDMTDLAYLLSGAGMPGPEIQAELSRQFPGRPANEYAIALEQAQSEQLESRGLAAEPGAPTPPLLPGGTLAQWEAQLDIVLPDGERQTQHIRVDRLPGDTDDDVRLRIIAAALEIQTIIAERGGQYDVQTSVTDYYPV